MSNSAEVTYQGTAEVIFDPVIAPGGSSAKATAITAAALAALAEANGLVAGALYSVTDTGALAVANGASSYRNLLAAHVGPEAPDDTTVIWFDTSNS